MESKKETNKICAHRYREQISGYQRQCGGEMMKGVNKKKKKKEKQRKDI